MGTYGDEFENVGLLADQRGVDPATNAIRAAILRRTLSATRGGILYFPPGSYLISDVGRASHPDLIGRLDAFLFIPEWITLRFSPGAILLLDDSPGFDRLSLRRGRPALEIAGGLEVGPQQVFSTRASSMRGGAVVLTSRMIDVVYPEWWGAVSAVAEGPTAVVEKARRDTAALQAAFDAAHRFRRLDVVRLAPIPIELAGPYHVNRTLFLGAESPLDENFNQDGFILRGRSPNGTTGRGRATFVCAPAESGAPPSFSGDAMLDIRGRGGFVIEDVTFDARDSSGFPAAPEAVRVQRMGDVQVVEAQRTASGNSAQAWRFVRCGFIGARKRLAQLGAPLPSARGQSGTRPVLRILNGRWTVDVTASPFSSAATDLLQGGFDNCYFESVPDERPGLRTGPDGIVFRASETFGLSFRGCIFTGGVRAMIRQYGGTFYVSNSTFHVSPVAAVDGVAPRALEDESSLGTVGILQSPDTVADADRDNGVDVFMAWPHFERRPGAEVAIDMGSFVAQQIESQSWRFLATAAPHGARPWPIGRDVLLENVSAGSATTVRNAAEVPPPCVDWRLQRRSGPNLVAVGCRFKGPPSLSGKPNRDLLLSSGRIAVGAAYDGYVIVAGTRANGETSCLFDRANQEEVPDDYVPANAPSWLRVTSQYPASGR